jgi:glycerol-3-phosphate acyltransferase PlsY
MHKPLAITVFAACASVLIILQHTSNIKKLLNGTENSFKRDANG